MKKLLILALLFLLTGCVTYYQPETALEDGVYYAEDDPKYVVYQGPYAGYAYYPWWSLDYAYWYYPYSACSYWGPYYGCCSHGRNCGRGIRTGRPGHGQNLHAGNTNRGSRNRNDEEIDGSEPDADSQDTLHAGPSVVGIPYRNFVSTAPSGYSGNRGMVIRSSEAAKIGQSKIQPIKTGATSSGIVIATSTSPNVVTPANNAGRSASTSATTRPPTASRSSRPTSSRRNSASMRRASSGNRRSSRSRSRSSTRSTSKYSTPADSKVPD